MKRSININNSSINLILDNSSNASRLIEEALIYYINAIEVGSIGQAELNRISMQGLINFKGGINSEV